MARQDHGDPQSERREKESTNAGRHYHGQHRQVVAIENVHQPLAPARGWLFMQLSPLQAGAQAEGRDQRAGAALCDPSCCNLGPWLPCWKLTICPSIFATTQWSGI